MTSCLSAFLALAEQTLVDLHSPGQFAFQELAGDSFQKMPVKHPQGFFQTSPLSLTAQAWMLKSIHCSEKLHLIDPP